MLKSTLETTCSQLSKADKEIYDKLTEQLAKGDSFVMDELRKEIKITNKMIEEGNKISME